MSLPRTPAQLRQAAIDLRSRLRDYGYSADTADVLVLRDLLTIGLAQGQTAWPIAGPRGEVLQEILQERLRQIDGKGWTEAHDDGHVHGELARAACYYAMPLDGCAAWPFAPPAPTIAHKDPRRRAVIAAALLVAEIERLDRAAAKASREGGAANL